MSDAAPSRSLRGQVRRLWSASDRQLSAEDEQRRSKLALRLVREFEEQGSGWFWQTDRTGRLTYLSDKVAKDLGCGAAGAVGSVLASLFKIESEAPETERTIAFYLASRTSFSELSVGAIDGDQQRRWSISGRPTFDAMNQFEGFIGSGSDLTETRRSEAEVKRLALFDGLTGLANRQRMRLTLDQTLLQSRTSYRSTSLLLLDLDRFKAVNDTLGHQTGDALLKQVAQRLLRAVGEAGLVGRLGGDEFEVVLPGEDNRDRLDTLARSIIGSLSQPYFVSGSSVSIGCSIGVAIAPYDGDDSETLVRNADLALYAAKADGRGVHRFFKAELLAGAQSRKQLEDDLRSALAQNQLRVAYQPVVSTQHERIVGCEALLRWDHPTRGPISPAEFIPIAEDCGLIETIGEWVLRTATTEAAGWPDWVRVAVNVSPIQFANAEFPKIVTRCLAASGIMASRLELEITESVFLNGGPSTSRMFKQLKGLGVRLALDDFGTGYSSLGYLREAPFDKIKIDQSFVRGAAMPGNRNAAIIQAIVTLADMLGMETTAEGVETQDEIELVRRIGCSHIQGYVYGTAISADAMQQNFATDSGQAVATGFKVSRSPRVKMLRWARLKIGGAIRDVRIRNMGEQGAMIDGLDESLAKVDACIGIEIIEGQMTSATVRWARGGQAGIQFDDPFNLEQLNSPPGSRSIRR